MTVKLRVTVTVKRKMKQTLPDGQVVGYSWPCSATARFSNRNIASWVSAAGLDRDRTKDCQRIILCVKVSEQRANSRCRTARNQAQVWHQTRTCLQSLSPSSQRFCGQADNTNVRQWTGELMYYIIYVPLGQLNSKPWHALNHYLSQTGYSNYSTQKPNF